MYIYLYLATNPPNLSKEIYEECKKKKIVSLDAPVTGNIDLLISLIFK